MFSSALDSLPVIETDVQVSQVPELRGQRFDWKMLRLDRLPNLERHWHPQSESYAPVDALLSALDKGWIICGEIYYEECFLSKRRRVFIFHFALWRDGECVYMPILSNPFLQRFVMEQLSSFVIVPM